jgi:cobalt-zinc-cadmium efflux system outer membrane protein
LLLFSALAAALPGWCQSPAAAPAQGLTLTQVLTAARDNSDVLQSRHTLAAAQADIRSADHAPAPVLSLGASSIDLQNGVGGGNLFTRKQIDKSIGVDWTWERGNKRALRTQAAQRNADAAQADVEDMQLQQLRSALDAYYDLLAAQERVQETRAIEHDLAELERLATRRVKAGDLSEQDAARTQIEAEHARAETQSAELEREQAAATLQQITARDAGLPACACDWPSRIDGAPAGGDLAAWAESRPDVRAALARVQAAQSALDNAQALRKADVTLGASFNHFPGTSTRMVELRAQFPLQWGYKFEGEIGRAQAEYAHAQEALDKTRRVALLELQTLQKTLNGTSQRARRYDGGILPKARQVAQSAELAYSKGAISLTDLLDARRTLRSTLLDGLSARADHAKALGQWLLRTQPQTLLP